MYFGCYEMIELQPSDSRNILWNKAELSGMSSNCCETFVWLWRGRRAPYSMGDEVTEIVSLDDHMAGVEQFNCLAILVR